MKHRNKLLFPELSCPGHLGADTHYGLKNHTSQKTYIYIKGALILNKILPGSTRSAPHCAAEVLDRDAGVGRGGEGI